jgi:site-specific DNA recombinase
MEFADKEGWQVVKIYSDAALSMASMFRPGIQALPKDVVARQYDIVLSEALDRISRDQEDVAGFFKRTKFADAKIYSLTEGVISELHIGLKGAMNALTLNDLAFKTRRGMGGRIKKGKSAGGITYGYDVVKQLDPNTGEPIRGDRTINAFEAGIVRRIFTEYVEGSSPQMIASRLNKDGVPGPRGSTWGASTL